MIRVISRHKPDTMFPRTSMRLVTSITQNSRYLSMIQHTKKDNVALFYKTKKSFLSNFSRVTFSTATTATAATAATAATSPSVDQTTNQGSSSSPGIVIGAIISLLAGYVWHHRQGTNAAQTIIDSLEESSPLAPTEIRTLRESNSINATQFAKLVQATKQSFPDGKATFAQFAWLAHKILLGGNTQSIKNHFILERVALTMQQRYEDAYDASLQSNSKPTSSTADLDTPATDLEASKTDLDTSSNESATSKSDSDETRNHTKVSTYSAARNLQPLSVKELLVLYSVLVQDSASARLDILSSIVTDQHSTFQFDTVEQVAQAEATEFPISSDTQSTDKTIESKDDDTQSTDKTIESKDDDTQMKNKVYLTQSQMLDLIDCLRHAWQLPSRLRTIEKKTYPLPIIEERTAQDHLDKAFRITKIDKELIKNRGGFTKQEAERLAFSRGICAWGECFRASE